MQHCNEYLMARCYYDLMDRNNRQQAMRIPMRNDEYIARDPRLENQNQGGNRQNFRQSGTLMRYNSVAHQGYDNDAMAIPSRMPNASVPMTTNTIVETESDDDASSTVGRSSIEPGSSPSLSPEPISSEQTTTDATSLVPSNPANHMLSALHAAKLTTKVDFLPKSESSGASRLKRSFSIMSGRHPSGKRLQGEADPENREIVRLRQDENLEFEEIARIMNEKRVKAHTPGIFTPNAIYSRYKRNGPLIAAADGKEFVPAARDKKVRGRTGINFKKAFILEGFTAEEDELLVRAVKDIDDKKWSLVAERLKELGGREHAPEMCSNRYAYL